MSTFYWVGNDGNAYIKDGSRAINAGRFLGTNNTGGFKVAGPQGERFIKGTQIDNPSAGAAANRLAGSPAPAGGSGGGAGPSITALDRASINATQGNIDQLGPLLQAALDAEAQKYRNIAGGFDAQETGQRKSYETGTVTNQQNYDANMMDSVRAGIKGLSGLRALLRGTGGGGGDAEDWAEDTVSGVAAKDIRGGLDTQRENQGQLDTSLSTFLTDLGIKRKGAEDTFENNKRATIRDNRTTLQKLYQDMAGLFKSGGDDGSAASFVNRAASLTPEIAANSRTAVSSYDTTPVVVKAPEITAFAAPTDAPVSSSEATGAGGQIGSGIFTLGERRRKAPTAAPPLVPIGV